MVTVVPVPSLGNQIADAATKAYGVKGDQAAINTLVSQYNAGKISLDGAIHAAQGGYTIKDPLLKQAATSVNGSVDPQVAALTAQQTGLTANENQQIGDLNTTATNTLNTQGAGYGALHNQLNQTADATSARYGQLGTDTGNQYDSLISGIKNQYQGATDAVNSRLQQLGIGGSVNDDVLGQQGSLLGGLAQVGKTNAVANDAYLGNGLATIGHQAADQATATGLAKNAATVVARDKSIGDLRTQVAGQLQTLAAQASTLTGQKAAQTQALYSQLTTAAQKLATAQALNAAKLDQGQQKIGISQQNADTSASKAASEANIAANKAATQAAQSDRNYQLALRKVNDSEGQQKITNSANAQKAQLAALKAAKATTTYLNRISKVQAYAQQLDPANAAAYTNALLNPTVVSNLGVGGTGTGDALAQTAMLAVLKSQGVKANPQYVAQIISAYDKG